MVGDDPLRWRFVQTLPAGRAAGGRDVARPAHRSPGVSYGAGVVRSYPAGRDRLAVTRVQRNDPAARSRCARPAAATCRPTCARCSSRATSPTRASSGSAAAPSGASSASAAARATARLRDGRAARLRRRSADIRSDRGAHEPQVRPGTDRGSRRGCASTPTSASRSPRRRRSSCGSTSARDEAQLRHATRRLRARERGLAGEVPSDPARARARLPECARDRHHAVARRQAFDAQAVAVDVVTATAGRRAAARRCGPAGAPWRRPRCRPAGRCRRTRAPSAASASGPKPAALVPGGGVASVAPWSISVPKIDRVPSRLSISSMRRDWIGQSISEAVSISQNPPARPPRA